MVAISSCLMGSKCRYNGTMSHKNYFSNDFNQAYIEICPEILAGFKTPRLPCEIVGGSGEDVLLGKAKVMDREGNDITEQMITGAKKALAICLQKKVTVAYLQARSPSCGYGTIYDGSFTSTLITGNGILSALLLQNKIKVINVMVMH